MSATSDRIQEDVRAALADDIGGFLFGVFVARLVAGTVTRHPATAAT
jgi:hypothetical protein